MRNKKGLAMTDKTSTQITFPPAYSCEKSSNKKIAKICALTSICISIIIAAAVCLGLYFTRDNFERIKEFTLNMKNNNEDIPVTISLHSEDKLEYITVPKTSGYNEVTILRDYNQGLMAIKDLTDGGVCLIGAFDGKPQDIKEIHKTLTDYKNLGIKLEKEVTFSILLDVIHPEVLTFAAGKAIAQWCNSSSYWIVTNNLSMKKRSLSSLPTTGLTGVPANLVQANPVPLTPLINNGGQILDLNSFLSNLGNRNSMPGNVPIAPGISPVANIPPNTITPVVLFGGNPNANRPPVSPIVVNPPVVVPAPVSVPAPLPIPVPVPAPLPPPVPIIPSPIPNPNPFPISQPPPQPINVANTVASCDTKCAVALGLGALNIAQPFYFCDFLCAPKQFINRG